MKRGDVVEFKEPPAYAGKKGVIVRISRKTGSFTVKLIQDVSAGIPKGHEVTTAPYTVRSAAIMHYLTDQQPPIYDRQTYRGNPCPTGNSSISGHGRKPKNYST